MLQRRARRELLTKLTDQRGRHFSDSWLDQQISRCEDLDWAAYFRGKCPVEGAGTRDYLQKTMSYSDVNREEQFTILGIRFFGGDTARPFLKIVADTGSIVHAPSLKELVSPWVETFSPDALHLVSWGPDKALTLGAERPDQLLFGRSVTSELAHLATPEPPWEIVPIVPDQASTSAMFASHAYALWESLQPWRSGRLFPISPSELLDTTQSGIALEAREGGTTIGLIAALPHIEPNSGMSGWCIIEEVVSPEASGRGLATSLQRALLRALAYREPNTLLFGTIDHDNHGSIATARTCGRSVMASFDFWPMPASR